MEQNDPLPRDQVLNHLSNIENLEDIELTVSNIVTQKQPSQQENIPSQKPQGWFGYLKEKLEKISQQMKTLWKDDNNTQTPEDNINFFKTPKRKDKLSNTLISIERNVPNLRREINRNISVEKIATQKKASLLNVLNYYRTVFIDKAKSKMELEGSQFVLPNITCDIQPLPQNAQQLEFPNYSYNPQQTHQGIDRIEKEEEKVVEPLKKEKKYKGPPSIKVYVLGKRMISKPSSSKKNKEKNSLSKTENKIPKKAKESLRISTYLQNIDSADERFDLDEDQDTQFARPTKKLFNNDKNSVRSEDVLLGLPDFHSRLKQNTFEKESLEKEINWDYQYNKPKNKTLEEDDFGSKNTSKTSKADLFSLKEEFIPNKFEYDLNNRNLYQNNQIQTKKQTVQSPSILNFAVPKSFNWDKSNYNNDYPSNEQYSITKHQSEESSGYIFESENKEIKVKEIITQPDNVSESTSFSSKSKDNQEPLVNNAKSKPLFPQFSADYKFSKFYRE